LVIGLLLLGVGEVHLGVVEVLVEVQDGVLQVLLLVDLGLLVLDALELLVEAVDEVGLQQLGHVLHVRGVLVARGVVRRLRVLRHLEGRVRALLLVQHPLDAVVLDLPDLVVVVCLIYVQFRFFDTVLMKMRGTSLWNL